MTPERDLSPNEIIFPEPVQVNFKMIDDQQAEVMEASLPDENFEEIVTETKKYQNQEMKARDSIQMVKNNQAETQKLGASEERVYKY